MANRYVILAYAAFAAILAWDYLAPRIKLAQVRRSIAARFRREQSRAGR